MYGAVFPAAVGFVAHRNHDAEAGGWNDYPSNLSVAFARVETGTPGAASIPCAFEGTAEPNPWLLSGSRWRWKSLSS